MHEVFLKLPFEDKLAEDLI